MLILCLLSGVRRTKTLNVHLRYWFLVPATTPYAETSFPYDTSESIPGNGEPRDACICVIPRLSSKGIRLLFANYSCESFYFRVILTTPDMLTHFYTCCQFRSAPCNGRKHTTHNTKQEEKHIINRCSCFVFSVLCSSLSTQLSILLNALASLKLLTFHF